MQMRIQTCYLLAHLMPNLESRNAILLRKSLQGSIHYTHIMAIADIYRQNIISCTDVFIVVLLLSGVKTIMLILNNAASKYQLINISLMRQMILLSLSRRSSFTSHQLITFHGILYSCSCYQIIVFCHLLMKITRIMYYECQQEIEFGKFN